MKCPALLQVLLAILLFIFSLWLPCQSLSPLGCWLGRAPLCSLLLGYGGAKWSPQRMFFILCPFLFHLNPRTSGRYNVFGTSLEEQEQAALCSFFPFFKLYVNRPSAHILFVFSVGHGKSDQPSARERILTSLLRQPSSLPLLHTQNFKTNVRLWCKIC